MQQAGVPMLYDTASNLRLPSLCSGASPLIPCFNDGNTPPFNPYKLKNSRLLGSASADTQPDRGNGSRLYEVNLWLWSYGRGQPRTMSIGEVEAVRQDRASEATKVLRRQRNAAGRRQPECVQRRRIENVCSQFTYDITYDIIFLHMISHADICSNVSNQYARPKIPD